MLKRGFTVQTHTFIAFNQTQKMLLLYNVQKNKQTDPLSANSNECGNGRAKN